MYLSNILNEYASYTYQIALYQVNPQQIDLIENAIETGQAEKIFQTGQTARYTLDSLEQVFTVGYGQVRSAFANQFNMVLSESNGTTLPERIVTAARALGIQNHLSATYLIKITFLGRDQNEQPIIIGPPFYYPVVITSMNIRTNESGATYDIRLVELASDAFSYIESVIKEQITVEAATVGEFVTEFERKLESTVELQLKYDRNALYPDEYSITFDQTASDWKQWRVQQTDDDSVVGNNLLDGKMQFIIPAGSSINDVIGIALQSTEEYKKILLDSGDFARRTGPGEEVSSNLDEFKAFYKIVPNITYGQYDPLRNSYVRKLEYRIKKYVMPDEIAESKEYANGILNAGIQASRVQKLKNDGYLRKVYQYIYTGLNTEVLGFDVQLNHTYFLISPVGGGQVGDSNVDQSRSSNDTTNVTERLKKLKSEAVALRRSQRETQQRLDQRIEKTYNNPINSRAENLPRLKGEYPLRIPQESLANAASTELQGLLTELETTRRDLAAKDAEIAEATQEFQARNAQQPAEPNIQARPGIFRSQDSAQENQVDIPVRFAGDVVDDSDIYGPENDKSGGVIQFGAVKSNLENSADLVEIELQVRGDPYWLGKPNSIYSSSRNDTISLADYEKGGIMFFLNLQLPIEEQQNGQRLTRSDYTVSGTYRVINVISTYRGGQFTQYLKAVRDLATNTSTAYDELIKGSGQQ